MKAFVALLALVAAASCQKFGPKGRITNFEVADCYNEIATFVADKSNLCWFWECQQNDAGIYDLIPRRCALGSRMHHTYTEGKINPCEVNFNRETNFDCTRTADESSIVAVEPNCYAELDCKNNGTAMYSGSICWCDCPDEWQGASDCSKLTVDIALNATTGGRDDENCWYENPPCDRVNHCENGGICHNNCKDFWCDCPVPFTRGKRCEKFDCETNPCRNGGTCDRGEGDQDEVNQCACKAGFTGLLCEIRDESVATETAATETAATETAATETAAVETAATETAAVETAATETEATETAATETTATETAATEAAVETTATETAATETAATETAATETAATETAATETAATETAATGTAATETAATETTATETAATQTAASKPAAAKTTATETVSISTSGTAATGTGSTQTTVNKATSTQTTSTQTTQTASETAVEASTGDATDA